MQPNLTGHETPVAGGVQPMSGEVCQGPELEGAVAIAPPLTCTHRDVEAQLPFTGVTAGTAEVVTAQPPLSGVLVDHVWLVIGVWLALP
jgi:hypothetical protein